MCKQEAVIEIGLAEYLGAIVPVLASSSKATS